MGYHVRKEIDASDLGDAATDADLDRYAHILRRMADESPTIVELYTTRRSASRLIINATTHGDDLEHATALLAAVEDRAFDAFCSESAAAEVLGGRT